MEEPYTRRRFLNTETWREERVRGIGGSDCASILGLSKWKTIDDLYNDKTGLVEPKDISYKPAVQYGKAAEAPIRELFALDFPEYKVTHEENLILENKEYPFMRYSPDGELLHIVTEEYGILEIKTTTIRDKEGVLQWEGKVADVYYPQVLQAFIVTECKYVILRVQMKWEVFDGDKFGQRNETRHFYFRAEGLLVDINYLRDKEIKFWQHVKDRKRPETMVRV